MAIGPEQLDIKKIAKLFLLKSEIGNTLTKEHLKEILSLFDESDWEGIRDGIFPVSQEKKDLREVIANCRVFLAGMIVGNAEGQYPQFAHDMLNAAIKSAEAICNSTYDGYSDGGTGQEGVEGRKLLVQTKEELLNIKQHVVNYIITEDGRLVRVGNEDIWFGYSKIFTKGVKWQPTKRLYLGNKPVYVSLNEIPTDFAQNTNYLRGLYIKDEKNQREIIITRENSFNVGGDSILVTTLMEDLGILLVDGAILDDYLFCADEDVRYAALASSYLEKQINPIPVTFFSGNQGIRYESNFENVIKFVKKTTDTLTDTAKSILNIISAQGVAEIASTTTISSNRASLTAKVLMDDGRKILVDNESCVITGIGTITSANLESLNPGGENSILYCSNGAKVTLVPTYNANTPALVESLELTLTSANGTNVKTFKVAFEEVLVDRHALTVNGKYISKYHPVDKSLSWVPATLLGKYYISTEPIDSDLRLYTENPEIIQIIGFIDETSGYLYSRMDSMSLSELVNPIKNYRLLHVNLGYYDGNIFASPEVLAINKDAVFNYLQFLDVLKGKTEIGCIESAFNPIIVNDVETGDYYWEGKEADIVHLPDTREQCKTYLNITAFKTLPASN